MGTRHITLHLTTVGPVHIGNGNRLGKKDYFAEGASIAILDARAFSTRLNARQLAEYIQFLSDASNRATLQDLFDRHSDMRKIAERSIAYTIDSRLDRARRGGYLYHDVAEFVKDSYGRPYVPGSSVKGMLRTALLAATIDGQQEQYACLYDKNALTSGRRKDWSHACSRIEGSVFRGESSRSGARGATNDILRYVSVADSTPLSTDDLVFAKKYDLFSKFDDGRHKKDLGRASDEDYWEGNSLDIYRESIKPGVSFEITVDIDERIDGYLGVLDANRLFDIFQRAGEIYDERFLSNFEVETESAGRSGAVSFGDGRCQYVYKTGPLKGSRCRNRAVEGTGYCNTHKDKARNNTRGSDHATSCYLGGGVGFSSKTVLHALLSDQDEPLDVISHALYAQFPTQIDRDRYPDLWVDVRKAGFSPREFHARYGRGGRLIRAKNDHRHWQDPELGVSPHTAKLAVVDGKKYQMGKCRLEIEE